MPPLASVLLKRPLGSGVASGAEKDSCTSSSDAVDDAEDDDAVGAIETSDTTEPVAGRAEGSVNGTDTLLCKSPSFGAIVAVAGALAACSSGGAAAGGASSAAILLANSSSCARCALSSASPGAV